MSPQVQTEQWLPLLSFRTPAAGNAEHLVISDPLHQRRAEVSRTGLLDLLAEEYRRSSGSEKGRRLRDKLKELGWRPGPELDKSTSNLISMWWAKGWHPSLEYFLWSRTDRFQDKQDTTGAIRRRVIRQFLDNGGPPTRVPSHGPTIALPEAQRLPDNVTLGTLLMNRRTIRTYVTSPAPLPVLSGILLHGLADVREKRNRPVRDELDYLQTHGVGFDFYLVIYSVAGLNPGVYRYDVANHTLVQQKTADLRAKMKSILIGMKSPETASWTFIITADFAQYQWRYRHERALRHLYMASGRVGQRMITVGSSYRFGTLPTPAMCDLNCCKLLDLDLSRQAPVYTLTMGQIPTLEGRA